MQFRQNKASHSSYQAVRNNLAWVGQNMQGTTEWIACPTSTNPAQIHLQANLYHSCSAINFFYILSKQVRTHKGCVSWCVYGIGLSQLKGISTDRMCCFSHHAAPSCIIPEQNQQVLSIAACHQYFIFDIMKVAALHRHIEIHPISLPFAKPIGGT